VRCLLSCRYQYGEIRRDDLGFLGRVDELPHFFEVAPGIEIPDSVTEIFLLGDGDSDRFGTECPLARAAARYAKQA
jgi:hypothetical protein